MRRGKVKAVYVGLRVYSLVLASILLAASSLSAQPASSWWNVGGSGLALSATKASTARAQDPTTFAVASDEGDSARKFDAGVGLLVPSLWGFRPWGGGAWFSLESGKIRWQTSYWYTRESDVEGQAFGLWRGAEYVRTRTDVSVIDSVDVAASWHFRRGRRIEPHILGGGGYIRFDSESCERSISRIGGRVVEEGGPGCIGGTSGGFMLVFGVGFDLTLGSGRFLRFQSRGDLGLGQQYYDLRSIAYLVSRTLVVGGGVRF